MHIQVYEDVTISSRDHQLVCLVVPSPTAGRHNRTNQVHNSVAAFCEDEGGCGEDPSNSDQSTQFWDTYQTWNITRRNANNPPKIEMSKWSLNINIIIIIIIITTININKVGGGIIGTTSAIRLKARWPTLQVIYKWFCNENMSSCQSLQKDKSKFKLNTKANEHKYKVPESINRWPGLQVFLE